MSSLLACALMSGGLLAEKKPNIIIYFADDISAREFPIYGSDVWIGPDKEDSRDPKHLAATPVMDRLAHEGCWVKTAWAATVCSPSRAMMMTGRFAHLHKWWHNGDKGVYVDAEGKRSTWPLYESSPIHLGHLAQQAGYGTYWAGKTQMTGDLTRYGYDEGCFTPGNLSDKDNPYTDFKLIQKKENGERIISNADTGKPVDTYLQHGWYWYPHIRLMNDPAAPGEMSWWPNSPESEADFGLHTYGPDVELDFVFNFMERQQEADKPFLIYHTTHLGHAGFDWFNPETKGQCWVGTPVVKWDGERYHRTEPKITGDDGVYETNNTVTEDGMHSHVEYIDYQIWCYLEKLKAMGLEKDTIIIIAADNGTGGYGKGISEGQKGTHVPFILYAPGVESTKTGEQDILLNISDVFPTLAEIMGVEIPTDYEINGESFWPWFTTDREQHRDWIYAYRGPEQLIRGHRVMKDGQDVWWDVSGEEPADLISYPVIKKLKKTSPENQAEAKALQKILPRFDNYFTEHGAPGMKRPANVNMKKYRRKEG